MMNILKSAITASAQNIQINENDYNKDGILFCGNCDTPKQASVLFLGERPFCLCRCESERDAAERDSERKRKQLEKTHRLRTQGIQDRQMHNWTFANDNGSNPDMASKLLRYSAKWDKMYHRNIGLFLWGNVGTGKTFFAGCIANALIDSGVPVLMTSFGSIINALSGFSIEDKNSYLDNFNRYKLLILDDLGVERQSEFAQEIVYAVVDGRYKSGQPLIVTTNLTLDELKEPVDTTHSRIYDRLVEMCVPIQFNGASHRRKSFQDKLETARTFFDD